MASSFEIVHLNKPKYRIISILAILISAVASILVYARIYYGVDFADESFYISQSFDFVLGNKPFIDEYSITQFAALLIYPLIKLYVLIVGSDIGIMLFARHIYLFLFIMLATLVFNTFKEKLTWPFSLIVSLVCVVFTPLNIPGLSYNLLGILFLTAGLLIAYQSISSSSKKSGFFLTGLCLSLAAFSYITFGLIGVLVSIILVFFDKKNISYFFYGIVPVFTLTLYLIDHAGLQNLKNLSIYLGTLGHTHDCFQKLLTLLHGWYTFLPSKIFVCFMLILTLIGWRIKNKLLQCSVFLIPILLALPIFPFSLNTINFHWFLFFTYISLLAPLPLWMLDDCDAAKRMFFIIWLPSFIAGIATGVFSGNSFWNAPLGLFPALIITMVSYILLAQQLIKQGGTTFLRNTKQEILVFCYMVGLISLIGFYKFSYIYGEAYFPQLQQRVEIGPYYGLYTSRAKYQYITTIIHDIRNLKANHEINTVVFYPYFSGGYLLSNLTPLIYSTMLMMPFNLNIAAKYYDKKNNYPDIVFAFNTIPGGYDVIGISSIPILNPIKETHIFLDSGFINFLNKHNYRQIVKRDFYSIYMKSSLFIE